MRTTASGIAGGSGEESRAPPIARTRVPAIADQQKVVRAQGKDDTRGQVPTELAKCEGSHLNRTAARRRLAPRGLLRLLLVGRSVGGRLEGWLVARQPAFWF